MHFDPWDYTSFNGGQTVMAVRESKLDKATSEQDKRLLSPWADALARAKLLRELRNMPTVGEA